jgi:uncharacterized protein DUF4440
MEDAWLKNEHDLAALDKILASDFLHPVSTGNFLKKAEHIYYSNKSRPSTDLKKRFEGLNVRLYGDVGIVNGILVAGNEKGEDVERTIFTDVFVYREDRWQTVNAQENKVEKRKIPD